VLIFLLLDPLEHTKHHCFAGGYDPPAQLKWTLPDETGGEPILQYVLQMQPSPLSWEGMPNTEVRRLLALRHSTSVVGGDRNYWAAVAWTPPSALWRVELAAVSGCWKDSTKGVKHFMSSPQS
jgi:hypothetical protein